MGLHQHRRDHAGGDVQHHVDWPKVLGSRLTVVALNSWCCLWIARYSAGVWRARWHQ